MRKLLCTSFTVCAMLTIAGCNGCTTKNSSEIEKNLSEKVRKALHSLPDDQREKLLKSFNPTILENLINSYYWNDETLRSALLICREDVIFAISDSCRSKKVISYLSVEQIKEINQAVLDLRNKVDVYTSKIVDFISNGKNLNTKQIEEMYKLSQYSFDKFMQIPDVEKIESKYYKCFNSIASKFVFTSNQYKKSNVVSMPVVNLVAETLTRNSSISEAIANHIIIYVEDVDIANKIINSSIKYSNNEINVNGICSRLYSKNTSPISSEQWMFDFIACLNDNDACAIPRLDTLNKTDAEYFIQKVSGYSKTDKLQKINDFNLAMFSSDTLTIKQITDSVFV